MKHDDWTNHLRERLADGQADVPDGLWDKINQRLNEQADSSAISDAPRHNGKSHPLRLALWMVSAAAVALLFVMIVYEHDKPATGMLVRQSVPHVAPHKLLADAATAKPTTREIDEKLHVSRNIVASNECVSAESAVEMTTIYVASADDPTENAEAHSLNIEGEKTADMHPSCDNQTHVNPTAFGYATDNTSHRQRAPHYSIAVNTGGSFVDSRVDSHPAVASFANVGQVVGGAVTSCDYNNNSYSLLAVRYKETKHHRQPLTFGLSVGMTLMPRLSVYTGLVYTWAASDFISSSGKDDIVSEQRLHYIGIPLTVKYTACQLGRLQVYGQAGVQADFNVKATQTTSGIKSDVDKDRVQMSAGIAAGIQYNVVPHVGLYAEPGIKYYFDNRSQVETIYKDKPWAFSMQMGLRFDF